MNQDQLLTLVVIVALGALVTITIVGIYAIIVIYLREIVKFKYKSKINIENGDIDTDVSVDSQVEN